MNNQTKHFIDELRALLRRHGVTAMDVEGTFASQDGGIKVDVVSATSGTRRDPTECK